MWVKKNADEREETRRRENRKDITVVCGLALVATIFMSALPRLKSGDPHFTHAPEFLRNFVTFIVPVYISMTIVYLLDKRSRRREVICPKCERSKYDDGIMDCSCRGRFEYLSEMKWVK